MNCPDCSSPIRTGSRRCDGCGRLLGELSGESTTPASQRRPQPGPAGSRFQPGETLAGRYRIVECVGKGGMGEVYHAEDLTLEQPVALKFLPAELARDAERLARFRREVRTAREISHPFVCRVHDIGEADGLPFLSMEYIRGEDLRSLLRRIGRLPGEKALEIAKQLASGLAAAHDKGILHRDLKPANVMLDQLGRARITDFGLAAAANSVEAHDIRSGTPAYMAPEQLAGTEVTERSDLYSLGLVLYELFTGRAPFASAGPERSSPPVQPPPPSSLVEGLDPAVERVILRCLEHEPQRRPQSAHAIRAALPGQDPLAYAVARGETPATALVAEASEAPGLTPVRAWVCLGSVVASLAVAVGLGARSRLTGIVPLPKSPEVLAADARAILGGFGYPGPQRDSTSGFSRDVSYVDHLLAGEHPRAWWPLLARGDPGLIRFWYRESPRFLVPHRVTEFFPGENDPPTTAPGSVGLQLDTRGRLRRLETAPPELEAPGAAPGEPDWSSLFAAAGFEANAFTPVEPRWFPPHFADRRAAWEGVYPEAPEILVRIEAAAFRGRIVAFRLIEPWTRPLDAAGASHWVRPEEVVPSAWARLAHMGFHLLFMLGLAFLARHNLRLGRGDTKLAFRLGLYVFVLVMLHWAFGAHHVPERSELEVFFGGLYRGFFAFGLAWLCYVALEPYARKLWPRSMISWVRLLNGRFRDPAVGRDVLLGCVYGAFFGAVFKLPALLSVWLGGTALRIDLPRHPAELVALRGPSEAISELFAVHVNILTHILFLIGGLLLLRFVFRRTAIAVAIHGVLYVSVYASGWPMGLLTLSVWIVLWYFFFFRFGWVPILVATFVADLLGGYPLTTDASAWYAHATLLVACVCLGLAVYGFRVALAGRPAFHDLLVGDELVR